MRRQTDVQAHRRRLEFAQVDIGQHPHAAFVGFAFLQALQIAGCRYSRCRLTRKVCFNGFLNHCWNIFPLVSRRVATRKVWKGNAMRSFGITWVDINRVQHAELPTGLSQARLIEDALYSVLGQVFFWVRHCDFARLDGMLKLVMRSHDVHQKPAVRLDFLDDVFAIHVCNYTQIARRCVFLCS